MTEHNEAALNEAKIEGGGISIRIIGAIAIVVAILLAFLAFTLASHIADLQTVSEEHEKSFIECTDAINELENASDYLTDQARLFVITGNAEYMNAYFDELYTTDRRGSAVETLRSRFSEDLGAAQKLQEALDASDELAKSEFVAMRLAAEYFGVKDTPTAVVKSDAVENEGALTPDEKHAEAVNLMFGEEYEKAKANIRADVEASSSALLTKLDSEVADTNQTMQSLLFQLRIAVALLLCVVMILVLVLLMYVLKPLNHYIKHIEKNEPLAADGSYELRYLANAYNAMYEDNSKRIQQLREFAERDPLTGISNRNGYDNFLAKHTRDIALLLIDIDNFREFNKVYGRDTGNAVMVKLAKALSAAFRSTDFPCRIESDLFAVIMTNMNVDLHEAVSKKIGLVNSILADDSDDLPLVTISVGVAFSTEGMSDHDVYEAAETALEQAVKSGRNCIAFYGESTVILN